MRKHRCCLRARRDAFATLVALGVCVAALTTTACARRSATASGASPQSASQPDEALARALPGRWHLVSPYRIGYLEVEFSVSGAPGSGAYNASVPAECVSPPCGPLPETGRWELRGSTLTFTTPGIGERGTYTARLDGSALVLTTTVGGPHRFERSGR